MGLVGMKRCLIVGAGGFGREALSWALAVKQDEWRIGGFLDSNTEALAGKNMPCDVVGDPAEWQPQPDEVFIAGIGDSETRLLVCGGLIIRGAQFVTVIHPSVTLGLSARIGTGCVLAPNAVLSANATIEALVLLNVGATLGHDCIAGEGTTVSSHCDVMGYARLGRGVFMGSHSCVLPGLSVGDFAVVGAGSAVVRNVAPRTTVLGVPAQLLFTHRD